MDDVDDIVAQKKKQAALLALAQLRDSQPESSQGSMAVPGESLADKSARLSADTQRHIEENESSPMGMANQIASKFGLVKKLLGASTDNYGVPSDTVDQDIAKTATMGNDAFEKNRQDLEDIQNKKNVMFAVQKAQQLQQQAHPQDSTTAMAQSLQDNQSLANSMSNNSDLNKAEMLKKWAKTLGR